MKKYLSILALAALTACSNEEDFSFNPNEIRLTSTVNSMTRINSFDVQSTQIESGQQVGVKIEGAESEHSNIAWTVGNNGELTTNDPICWGAGDITVYAYHPYNSGVDFNNSFDFRVSDDQTDDGYKNSDLMWAYTTSPQTTKAVELNFTHKLSKINVVLENSSESDVNLNNATITICNVNRATTFEPWSGHFYNEFESGDILAGTATNQASAIIVPQYISSGKKFIKIEAEGKTYYYTLNNNKQFEPGMVYTFRLSIKASVVVSLSETVTNWTDGGTTEGGLTEYVDPAKNSRIPFDPTQETLTLEEGMVLTGNEIYVLRRMLGAEEFDESERGVLHTLDMSKATIAEGGVAYWESMYTKNNVITEGMFRYCNNLVSVKMPNSVTEIEYDAFSVCPNLTDVVLPENLEILNDYIFSDTPLKSVALPESLREIRGHAFGQMYELTSITIPDGVTEFGDRVFYRCSKLTEIKVSDNQPVLQFNDGVLYNKQMTKILWFPMSETEYSFPATVIEIGDGVFAETNINSLTLPEAMEIIPNAAFERSQLSSVVLPTNLIEIQDWAFYGTKLTAVTFPAGVKSIGYLSFCNVALTEVHCLSKTPPTLDAVWAGEKGKFDYLIPENAKLYVPAGSLTAYQESEWANHFTTIVEE